MVRFPLELRQTRKAYVWDNPIYLPQYAPEGAKIGLRVRQRHMKRIGRHVRRLELYTKRATLTRSYSSILFLAGDHYVRPCRDMRPSLIAG